MLQLRAEKHWNWLGSLLVLEQGQLQRCDLLVREVLQLLQAPPLQSWCGVLVQGPSLVQGSINIVNQNGFRELPGMEPVALGIVMVDELSGGSTVHKGVDGPHFSCISGFKLDLQFEGGQTGSCSSTSTVGSGCFASSSAR